MNEGGKIQIIREDDLNKVLDANEAEHLIIRNAETGETTLNLDGAKVIEEYRFAYGRMGLEGRIILPEGITEIEQSAFEEARIAEIVFPKSLRKVDMAAFEGCKNLEKVEFKEGIKEIDFHAFMNCGKLKEVHLPDSLKNVDMHAFIIDDSDVENPTSDVTLYLSGKLALYLDEHSPYKHLPAVIAKGFVIDGEKYDDIKQYAQQAMEQEKQRREAEGRERQAQARREREEAERKATEARKKAERDRINAQIYDLSQEMDSLKGLFAGMKRKKLQKQIDELNEQLRRL